MTPRNVHVDASRCGFEPVHGSRRERRRHHGGGAHRSEASHISNLPSNGRVGEQLQRHGQGDDGDGTTSVTSSSISVCTASRLVGVLRSGRNLHALRRAHLTRRPDYAAADGDTQTFTVASAHGYWLVGSDGGIFTSAPPCSTARRVFSSVRLSGSRRRPTDSAIGSSPPTAASSLSATPVSTAPSRGWVCTRLVPGFRTPQRTDRGHGAQPPGGRLLHGGFDGGVLPSATRASPEAARGSAAAPAPRWRLCPTPRAAATGSMTQTGHVYTFGDAPYFGRPGRAPP